MCLCVSSYFDPAAVRLEADTFLCPPRGLTEGGGKLLLLLHLIRAEEEAAGRAGTAQRSPPSLLRAPATTAAALRTPARLFGSDFNAPNGKTRESETEERAEEELEQGGACFCTFVFVFFPVWSFGFKLLDHTHTRVTSGKCVILRVNPRKEYLQADPSCWCRC